jgi:hypothetical protein
MQRMKEKILLVRVGRNEEAGVWVATSDDVPGLATESASLEELSAKLAVMVPELLDANGFPDGHAASFGLIVRKPAVLCRVTC